MPLGHKILDRLHATRPDMSQLRDRVCEQDT